MRLKILLHLQNDLTKWQIYISGKLDSSAESSDLKVGTILELPLWLIQSISTGRQPLVMPMLPKIYKEAYREILKADASAVDLHKFNLHFYEFGGYVKKIDPRGEVKDCLEQVSVKLGIHNKILSKYYKLGFRHSKIDFDKLWICVNTLLWILHLLIN